MDMRLSAINTLDKSSGTSNPATIIQRPKDGSYWRVTDHVFGEVAAVRMSAENSDHDYNYKTEFKTWK